jgi:hypothetical protein
MRHSVFSAQLIGKYRILWLRWSQLVSQVGKFFNIFHSFILQRIVLHIADGIR